MRKTGIACTNVWRNTEVKRSGLFRSGHVWSILADIPFPEKNSVIFPFPQDSDDDKNFWTRETSDCVKIEFNLSKFAE